ncbi:hypothetical protein J6590_102468 [Homalodisca vitripennis]|nr:hypothetical protein J6590_102468 [Homalodisca vitripennis]
MEHLVNETLSSTMRELREALINNTGEERVREDPFFLPYSSSLPSQPVARGTAQRTDVSRVGRSVSETVLVAFVLKYFGLLYIPYVFPELRTRYVVLQLLLPIVKLSPTLTCFLTRLEKMYNPFILYRKPFTFLRPFDHSSFITSTLELIVHGARRSQRLFLKNGGKRWAFKQNKVRSKLIGVVILAILVAFFGTQPIKSKHLLGRLQDTERHRRGVWRSFSNETNWRQSCIKYFSAQCNRAKSNETDTVGDIEPIKAFRQSWHFARNYAILRSWEQHGADRLVASISIAVEQGCTLPSGFGILYY